MSSFIDNVDGKVWEVLTNAQYPKIKQLLKEKFNIETEDENGNCKSTYTILSELAEKFNECEQK